jgi:hypothetical protein
LLSGSLQVKQLTFHEFVSLFHVSDKVGSRQVLSCPLQETTTALVTRTFLLVKKADISDSRELAPCTSVYFFGANFRRKAQEKSACQSEKRFKKGWPHHQILMSLDVHSSIRDYRGATSTIDL